MSVNFAQKSSKRLHISSKVDHISHGEHNKGSKTLNISNLMWIDLNYFMAGMSICCLYYFYLLLLASTIEIQWRKHTLQIEFSRWMNKEVVGLNL